MLGAASAAGRSSVHGGQLCGSGPGLAPLTARSQLFRRRLQPRCRVTSKEQSDRAAALLREQSGKQQVAAPPPPARAGGGAADAPPPAGGLLPPVLANSLAVSDPDRQWITVVGLSALVALICSVDRAAISVAILPMSEEYGWTDSTKGAINSAFYVGYTLSNLAAGWLATSVSTKQLLGAGVVLWSMFTISTPIAASTSLSILLGNRAVMGAGEGVTFPCIQSLVKNWVPADSRTRALTLIYSGAQLGTIVALVTAPAIISAYGWPAVFQIYGASGFVWMLLWQRLVAEASPSQRLAQAAAEAEAAAAAAAAGGNGSSQAGGSGQLPRLRDVPWKSFFTNKPFLAILMAHASFGVGHYVCLSWLPTYYNQEFGVDVQQSATLSVLPWFVTVLVSNSAGWIADTVTNRGYLTMTQTRKAMQAVGSLAPAACLLYLNSASSHKGGLDMGDAVLLLTGTLSLGGFQSAGFASNHQDISSRYAAVLFGITNALSSLMGTCSVYGTGLILEATGSWELVFSLVAGFYVFGAVGYLAWASSEQQFE